MTDEFDLFLASELAPPERRADRQFVTRVQARIALEARLREQRRSTVVRLGQQLLALAAVGAALWWIGRVPIVAGWVEESPELALLGMLGTFALLIAIFSMRPDDGSASYAAP